MKVLRDHGLTIVLVVLTVLTLVGMAAAGLHSENQTLLEHRQEPLRLASYLSSGAFLSALFENWESEFLQMTAYVMLTAFLFQRGSAESRDPDAPERDYDDLPAGPLFIVSFVCHWLASVHAVREEATRHSGTTHSLWVHLWNAEFWFESLQNWQSEFLSTAVLVVFSIFLRFRGSPESKPVRAPHRDTGA
jgi:hypothetical protein